MVKPVMRLIGVDWGTSRVRAWAIGEDGEVLATVGSDRGMSTLAPEEYEGVLLGLVEPWLVDAAEPMPTLVCGMAGARQGWLEAPYELVPCAPLVGASSVRPELRDRRLRVVILHGLAQRDPPDVMRGEETQVAGLLAAGHAGARTLCLPGTHSKWVRLDAGRISRFRTAATGELFAVLGEHSVLRHAMDEGDATTGETWHPAAFDEAVLEMLDAPETLVTSLFSVRARALLGTPPGGAGRARLSGLLIGAELAATREWWREGRTFIIGAGALCARYAAALELAGGAAEIEDADASTVRGLLVAADTLFARPINQGSIP